VISLHGPIELKEVVSVAGKMNFFAVHQDQPFSGRDAPNNRHVVFLATAVRSGLPGGQGILVGVSKSPANATLRTGDSFSARDGRKIDLVHGALLDGSASIGKHDGWMDG